MKKSKKSRVSWASDSMLCQVKTFLTEDCPAKVASRNPSNLPPGFEPTEYAARRFISGIPRIQWKRPPKFILNDALRVGSGGESTETHSENLRIAKVLEAFYPHRSVIPARPWVSLAVLEEHFDDANTPNIRLTPIEDDPDLVAGVSGLAASAALSALMKTKNQGSLVDPDLLVKLLSDPKIVKNLLSDMTGKALEVTANNTHITKPQLVTDRNPPPNPGIGVPHNVPVSVRAPPLLNPTQLNLQRPASVFHTYPLPRVEDSYTAAPLKPTSPVDDLVVSEQKTQQSPGISTWNLDINRDDQVPVKNVDYYKNLIREHGGVNPATNETNKYKGRVDDDMKLVRVKIQKPCMFFGRAKGCRLGERCLYLHDRPKRSWTDVASHFPRAKRLKFGT